VGGTPVAIKALFTPPRLDKVYNVLMAADAIGLDDLLAVFLGFENLGRPAGEEYIGVPHSGYTLVGNFFDIIVLRGMTVITGDFAMRRV